ncbi:MAG: hypothetical protein KAI66_21160 [Lentisphaeria bacterium]|nr:hypothetical protein [Lentisphaeria bacterium]
MSEYTFESAQSVTVVMTSLGLTVVPVEALDRLRIEGLIVSEDSATGTVCITSVCEVRT